MGKSLFVKMGGTYRKEGDYLIPNLKVPENQRSIGIWGQRHLRYIKQNKKAFYLDLKISGKLNDYLAELNDESEEMFSRLVKQMVEQQGITEKLKGNDQMEWVRRLNAIRHQVKEIIENELIYV